MTETERKALALVNEAAAEFGVSTWDSIDRRSFLEDVVCRAIEQHEAFRQEVSDAVEGYNTLWHKRTPGRGEFQQAFHRFIIAKPDPLVWALNDMAEDNDWYDEYHAAVLRAAIEKRGGKITWGEG